MIAPVSEPVVLYVEAFLVSPFDGSCFVALREKGVPFSTSTAMVREGRGQAQHLGAHALVGQVPVLQHGAFWLSESLAIVEYLEDAFPSPAFPRILPRDLRERARARQLLMWLRAHLDHLRRARNSARIFYEADRFDEPLPPFDEAAAGDAARLLDVTDRLVAAGRGDWLFGEFSMADFDLAFALMRLLRTGHAVPAAIGRFVERVWARPSVRAFVERPRPPYPPR